MIPLYLAPMAEFTTPPMRTLCEACGAERTYTEMVNAEGLCRDSAKTHFLLTTFPEERHVWAHLYGQDPERLALAAKIAEDTGRFEGIDLNAGCPVPRITKQGAGSALIKDLPLLQRILSAMTKAVSLPVSLKTRLGPHPQCATWRDTLHIAEDAGVASITFHARFTSQGHGGETHLDVLREIVSEAKIPVFGNGSVMDQTSAETMEATGVSALLIARKALENPNIFTFKPIEPFTLLRQHLALELRYRTLAKHLTKLTPEEATVITFRHHLFRYLKGLAGANNLRQHLMELHAIADIEQAITEMEQLQTPPVTPLA